MDVQLPASLRRWIAGQVKRGHYASTDDVVRAGLRLLVENERWREDANRKIEEGMADLRAGRVVDGDVALARIRRRLRARPRRKRSG